MYAISSFSDTMILRKEIINMLNNLSKLQIVTLNDFTMNIVNWLNSNDAIEDSLSDF